jgi:hypothetical protein
MAVEASMPVYGRAAVTGAIRNAAGATGTSFSYLLATAKIESDLDPSLTMKSSSAAGLFQFIDQTWLGTLKQAGPAFGYGDYANAITRTTSGRYVVEDPQMRKAIAQLKSDPTANAVMAGVLTQQNAAALARRIGRAPSDSELYVAHFLGAGGAGKLLELNATDPQTSAAAAFPAAAQANRSIFYDRSGTARSIEGVYGEISRRFKAAGDAVGVPAVGLASSPLVPTAAKTARAAAPVPDVAGTARVFAAASPAAPSSTAPAQGPRFGSLFSDAGRRSAIDPTVVALWSDPAPPQSTAAAAPAATGTFNLFGDLKPGGTPVGGRSKVSPGRP